MVRRRIGKTDVLSGADGPVGGDDALVQASVVGTLVAGSGSTTVLAVALPVLLLGCYADARLPPLIAVATVAIVASTGISFDPTPPMAGVLAGLAVSPWGLAASTLWAVVVATTIFTLIALDEPLWIAIPVAAVAAVAFITPLLPRHTPPVDIESGPPPAPRRRQVEKPAPPKSHHLYL